jgi:hypothetical protein
LNEVLKVKESESHFQNYADLTFLGRTEWARQYMGQHCKHSKAVAQQPAAPCLSVYYAGSIMKNYPSISQSVFLSDRQS